MVLWLAVFVNEKGGREGGRDDSTDTFPRTGDVRGERKLRPEHRCLEHADGRGRDGGREDVREGRREGGERDKQCV